MTGIWLAPEERAIALEALRFWLRVRNEQGVTGPAIELPRALADRLDRASATQ